MGVKRANDREKMDRECLKSLYKHICMLYLLCNYVFYYSVCDAWSYLRQKQFCDYLVSLLCSISFTTSSMAAIVGRNRWINRNSFHRSPAWWASCFPGNLQQCTPWSVVMHICIIYHYVSLLEINLLLLLHDESVVCSWLRDWNKPIRFSTGQCRRDLLSTFIFKHQYSQANIFLIL